MTQEKSGKILIGRTEWLLLPGLYGNRVVGKIDTGAKTCALHTVYTKPFLKDGDDWIGFGLHFDQGDDAEVVHCETQIKDRRMVRDSGGHEEDRFVIETMILIGGQSVSAEFSLTSRENMRYRCLVGRNVLNHRFIVDSGRTFLFDSG